MRERTMLEDRLGSLAKMPRRAVEAVFFTGLVAGGLYVSAIVLPLASGGQQ